MRLLTIVLTLASIMAATTHAGRTATPAAPVASQTYADALGDSPCCLDIGAVTVSNDAAGLLTLRIGLPNQSVAEPGRFVVVGINSDLDRSTGGTLGYPRAPLARPTGSDYRIRLSVGGDPVASLDRLTKSSAYPEFVAPLEATYDHGWAVTVDRRAIGGPAAFEFFVLAAWYQSDTPEWVDDAPDAAQGSWGWRYDTGLPPLVAPKPTVTAGRATLAPNPPRAGRRLVMRLPFTTPRPGTRAAVRCSADGRRPAAAARARRDASRTAARSVPGPCRRQRAASSSGAR